MYTLMKIIIVKTYPLLRGRSYVRFVSGAQKSMTYIHSNVCITIKNKPH